MTIFELDTLLGKGAYGHVWSSTLSNNKKIAVKFLTDLGSTLNHLEFEQEVRMLSKLCHPNIGKILDYGLLPEAIHSNTNDYLYTKDTPYLLLEFIHGTPLHRVKYRLNWPEIYVIFEQILETLTHAHAKGILHQDIKSKNIIVQLKKHQKPKIRLIDFGIATDFGKESSVKKRVVSGTPAYIAPEKWKMQNHLCGPWTDLYSCGIVLWDMLCGKRPFEFVNYIDMMKAHLDDKLPEFTPRLDCPESVLQILGKLLSKDPLERYVSSRRALYDWRQIDMGASLDTNEVFKGDSKFTETASYQTSTLTFDEEIVSTSSESSIILDHGSVTQYFNTTNSANTQLLIQLELDPPVKSQNPQKVVQLSPLLQQQILQNKNYLHQEDTVFHEILSGLPNYGVNLLGYRDTPLFGRETEQAEVLSIISDVIQSKSTQVLHLQGAKGVGTSRFARWVNEYLVEQLSAISFTSSGKRQQDSLVQLLSTQLRGNTEPILQESCLLKTPELLAIQIQQLCDWILFEKDNFSSTRYKFDLVSQCIFSISTYGNEQNLPILFIDDAKSDVLELVKYLLDLNLGPALILLTCDDSTDDATLTSLQQHSNYCSFRLSPLPAAAHKKILEYLLDCHSSALKSIISVSSGNPKISRQIIEDAIRNGHLELSNDGVKIQGGIKLTYRLEDKEYWQTILNRFAKNNESKLSALRLAALVGFSFWRKEWESGVCELGLNPSEVWHWILQRNLILLSKDSEECRFINPVLYKLLLEPALQDNSDWIRLNKISLRLIDEKKSKKAIWRKGQYYHNLGDIQNALSCFIKSLYKPPHNSKRALRQLHQVVDFIEENNIDSKSIGYVQYQRFLSFRARISGDVELFWKYNKWVLEHTNTPDLFYQRGLAMHDAITSVRVFALEATNQVLKRIREASAFAKLSKNPKLEELMLRSQFDSGELSFQGRKELVDRANELLQEFQPEFNHRAEWFWTRSASFLAMEREDFETVLKLSKVQQKCGKKNHDVSVLFSAYLHFTFYSIHSKKPEFGHSWIRRAEQLLPLLSPFHEISWLLVKIEHLYSSGHSAETIPLFEKAVELCHSLKRMYLLPFLTLIQLKNYLVLRQFDKATSAFLKVVDLSDHQIVNAYFELARLSIELGHKRFASAVCTNIIQGFPQDKNPHFYQRTIQLREQHSLPTRKVFFNSPERMVRALFND
jgi:serine/threonine protein kinase/tetratricopeptide (TPR) repeat protein